MLPALAGTLAADDRELGLAGERVAARFLRARGLRVLARRLRTARGEADLALLDRGVLVVCEVKTARRAGRHRPGERLGHAALARRARTARALARELGLRRSRVDLVEVVLAARRRPAVTWTRDLDAPLPRAPERPPGPAARP